MKRYLKDFELSYEFVKYSIFDCLSGMTSGNQRWTRGDTASFLADYVEKLLAMKNIPAVSKHDLILRIKRIARIDRERLYFLVDYIAEEMYLEIKEKRIKVNPIYYENRYDGI